MNPLQAEQHFPWYVDYTDTTNIDCQCGQTCAGMAGWATHITHQIGTPMIDEHRIETTAKVYLSFDTSTGKWVVDPITMDGSQLDSTDVDDSECECERDQQHQDFIAQACNTPLPTGAELIALLILAVGAR